MKDAQVTSDLDTTVQNTDREKVDKTQPGLPSPPESFNIGVMLEQFPSTSFGHRSQAVDLGIGDEETPNFTAAPTNTQILLQQDNEYMLIQQPIPILADQNTQTDSTTADLSEGETNLLYLVLASVINLK